MSDEPTFYVMHIDEEDRRDIHAVFRRGPAAGWIADFSYVGDAEQYAEARNEGEFSGQLELKMTA